jgi:putative ABC transport system permease protein
LLAVAGVTLGMLGTYGVQLLLLRLFPTFPFLLPTVWLGKGTLIAFAGSIFGALYPAWMAARKDPIDALAYE